MIETSASLSLDRYLVWDNVWPLEEAFGNGWDKLGTFASSGWNVLSLTVAGDNHDVKEAFERVAAARAAIATRADHCLLIERFADIELARSSGRLGITLHFEGGEAFGRNLDVVAAFRALGVTHNLLAFNNSNSYAAGCMEAFDAPLTALGRQLIRVMERVGMVVDLSHVGRRSSLDALDLATKPMIFSHSNADGVAPHPRNLTDAQIRGCAATGGLIGLSGSSGYLGDDQASTEAMFRHVDYVAQLVGDDHIALGLDIVFDSASLNAWARGRPDEWPMTKDPAWPGFRYARLDQLVELVERMTRAGYPDDSVRKFLGENYLNLMKQVLA